MFRLAHELIAQLTQPANSRRTQSTPVTKSMEVLEERTLLSADVIGRAANGNVYVGLSDGTQFTNELTGFIDPSITGDVFHADFNGDNLTDIMIVQENGPDEDVLHLFLMQANGNFAPAQALNIGTDLIDGDQQYLGVGDITGNGINDLVFMDQDGAGPTLTQKVYVVRGGNYLRPPEFEVQRTMVAWEFYGLADVDGDNAVEVIARSPLNGGWFRSISNSFHAFGGWTQKHTFENVMFGDFNGDGIDDVAGRIEADGRWLVVDSPTDTIGSSVNYSVVGPPIKPSRTSTSATSTAMAMTMSSVVQRTGRWSLDSRTEPIALSRNPSVLCRRQRASESFTLPTSTTTDSMTLPPALLVKPGSSASQTAPHSPRASGCNGRSAPPGTSTARVSSAIS